MTSKKSLLNKFILFLFSFLFFAFVNIAYAIPVASISAPEIILTGDTASLSAQNSTGNQLRYRWKLVGKPEGSGSQIQNSTQADTSFLVDREGVYLAELRVLEGSVWSTPKYKTISAVVSVGEIVLTPEVFEPSFFCKISFGLVDCEEAVRDFDISAPAGNFSLIIENEGVKKAFLSLNGVDLTDYYQLSGSNETVVKKTQLLAHNQLKLRFGQPGSFGEFNSKLKIKIVRNLLPQGQNASPDVSALPIKYFGSLGGQTQLTIIDPDQTVGHIISILVPAKNGEVSISPTGQITYEPDYFFLGDDQVVILVRDTGYPQKAQAVIISIQYQTGNEPPLLTNTLPPQSNGQTISGKIQVRDTAGQTHLFAVIETATNGTAVIDSAGNITYTPQDNFIGLDTFKVRVTDSGSPSAYSDIIVPVDVFENHAPVISSPTMTMEQGMTNTVLFTFSDVDVGQVTNISIKSLPAHGMATMNLDGVLIYTPDPLFYGQDLVEVSVKDNGHPAQESVMSLLVTVLENKPPTISFSPSRLTVSPGGTHSANYFIDDINRYQAHTVEIFEQPKNGTASIENNALIYTPNLNYVGQDEVTVIVVDNGFPIKKGFSTLQITVQENHPPVPSFVGKIITAGKDRNFTFSPNDPDLGQQHTYSISAFPQSGVLIPSPIWPNTITYRPNLGFVGNDQFKVVVTDNGAPIMAGEATVNMTVRANSAPMILSTTQLKLAQASTQHGYVHVRDEDGDAITLRVVGTSALGTASIVSENYVYFAADKNISGSEFLTIEARDNGEPSLTSTAQMLIEVEENHPPAPIDQNLLTSINQSLSFTCRGLDPDGSQILTYTIISPTTNGVVTSFGFGGYSYKPNTNFIGVDELTIRVSDNGTPSLFKDTKITINVQQNFPPVPVANDILVLEGSSEVTTVLPRDPNLNQVHTYTVASSPSHGVIRGGASGVFTYDANPGFVGQDQFIVTVTDNGFPKLSSNVVISVEVERNLPPNPIANNATIYQSQSAQIDVLPNDPNLALQYFTYQVVNQPTNGTVQANSSRFIYTPAWEFSGQDSFTVKVTDSGNPKLSGLKTINVLVVKNINPTIIANDINIFQGSIGTTQVNFTDPDVGQTHRIIFTSLPSHGFVTLNEAGLVTYTPNNKCNRDNDFFKVRVLDSAIPNGFSEKEIRVIVTPNTLPIISIEDFHINQRDIAVKQVVATDPDIGQILSYRIKQYPQHGFVSINETGQITYQDYNPSSTITSASFEIVVSDGIGCSNQVSTKVINVSIEPNHRPELAVENLVVEQGGIVHSSIVGSDVDQFQTFFYRPEAYPTKGLLNINYNTGEYSYTSHSSSGNDQFEMSVTDNGVPELSTIKMINVTIVPLNYPPVPTANIISLMNGKSAITTILANDPDVSQIHTYEIMSPLQFGWATVSSLGVVNYQAYEGTEGSETIQVKVTDNGAYPRSAIIAIPVEVVKNLAPSPIAQTSGLTSGETVQLIVEANDPNHARFPQTYTYRILNAPQVGTVSIDIQGNLTYTAPMHYSGVVELDVEVSDQGTPSLSGEARITFTIVANQAPVVAAQILNTSKNVSIQKQIVFTDANSANQTFTYSIVQQPMHGSVLISAGGQLMFTPNTGYIGTDELIVRVTDSGNPALSGEASYSVNVEDSSNTPPTLSFIEFFTQSDGFPKKYEFEIYDLEDSEGYVKEVHVNFGDNTELLVLNEDTPIVLSGEFALDYFEHNYRQSGTYTVTVTLIDDENAQSQFQTIVQVGNNHPPVARVNFTPNQGSLPLNLVADASASTDSDGTIKEFCFRVRKGQTKIYSKCTQGGLQLSYQIAEEGVYQARGCIYDNAEAYNCFTQDIYVGVPVPGPGVFKAFASIKASERLGNAPLNNVILDAGQSRGVNGANIVEYQWAIHGRVSNNVGQEFDEYRSGVNQTLNFPYAGVYDVNLLVIDENGNQGQSRIEIFVEENVENSLSIYSLYYGDNNFHFKMNTSGLSFGENQVFWDLGNGDVQQGFEAYANLESGIVHQIKLEAYDVNGKKYVLTKSIDLTETPTAPFLSLQNFPTQVQVNQSFILNASGSTDPNAPLRFRWWLGDGSPTINGVGSDYSVISHAFTTVGEKTIRLLVSNRQGLSREMEIHINVILGQAPTIAATVTPTSGLAPLLVHGQVQGFDPDGVILSYTWNLGNYRGARVKIGQNVSNIYSLPGENYVTVTALDSDGNRVTQFVDSINVGAFNKAPYVASETLSTRKNKILTHDIEFSDDDDEGQLHTFSIVSGPTHGIATVSGNGRIIYNPSLDYLGTDSLRVRVTDSSTVQAFGEATITIQVTGEDNLNPVIAGVDYDYETSSFPRKTFIYFDELFDPDGKVVKVTWDFGDNTEPLVIESNQLNEYDEVMHQYIHAGTYNVVITAEDNQGGTTSVSKEVVLAANQVPSAVFSVGTTGTGPYQVTLDATSSIDTDGSIQLYCWNVKREGIAIYDQCATSPVQTITTQNGGVASVELYVRDNDHASAFYETNFNIDSSNSFPPYVAFDTAGSRLGSDPFNIQWDSQATVAFQGKTISKKYWVISDTQLTDSFFEGSLANAEYFTPGTHVTRMQAVDSDGKRNSYEQLVYIGQNIPLKADFTVKTEDDLSVSFNAEKWTEGHYSGFFLWDFGDGTHEFDRYTNHTYNRSGKYKVTLTVLDIYGNLDIHEEVILVGGDTPSASPVGDFKMFGNVNSQINFGISGNSSDIVRWNFGDGTFDQGEISEKGNIAHTYTQKGVYRVTTTVTSEESGLSREFYKVVSIVGNIPNPQMWIVASQTTGPAPLQVSFVINHLPHYSPISYRWLIRNSRGDIILMSSQSTTSFNFTVGGNYTVEVITKDAGGNSDYRSYGIFVTDSFNKVKKKPSSMFFMKKRSTRDLRHLKKQELLHVRKS